MEGSDLGATRLVFLGRCLCMPNSLPAVGTYALLESLTDFVPDDFINLRWPIPRGRGPHLSFSAAQLWRVHLLAILFGGRSFNAVVRSLGEQRALRHFAHLPNARSIPDVRMLHEWRTRLGVSGLRTINDQLTSQILQAAPLLDKTVALIDATDLPARTQDKKKSLATGAQPGPRLERARSSQGTPAFSSATKSTP